MNRRQVILLGLAVSGWLAAPPLFAAVAPEANPYTPIVERNVFGLVPIPVAPPPVDPQSLVPPPKITPNGIMTLFGKLQVLFKVAGVTRPGQPPQDQSYVMCEGDRQDDIEVQKIDQKAAVITFNNHGVVQELPLVVSTATGGAPAGPVPAPRMPLPSIAPAAPGAPPVDFGSRFSRGQRVISAGNPSAGNAPGFGSTPTTVTRAPAQEPISPENQIILIEAQRMKAMQEGDPVAKIFPITPMTSQLTGNPADNLPAPEPEPEPAPAPAH